MKAGTSATFKSHIQRIHVAKEATNLFTQMQLAEKSMGILWEELFDQICSKNSQRDDIKEISSILNKLLQNYRQLFAITQKLKPEDNEQSNWTFTENILRELENQLQLL